MWLEDIIARRAGKEGTKMADKQNMVRAADPDDPTTQPSSLIHH